MVWALTFDYQVENVCRTELVRNAVLESSLSNEVSKRHLN
jgi:hypothetical protein